MVLGEQIDTIDKDRIISCLGKLSERDLDATAEAVKEHLGFFVLENIDAPSEWKPKQGCRSADRAVFL